MRRIILALIVTGLSGGAMAGAGYLLHAAGWHIAVLVTLPGGMLISAAFVLARRGSGHHSEATKLAGTRTVVAALIGIPSAGRGLPRRTAWVASTLILTAGAAMFGAGYMLARGNFVLAAAMTMLGGWIIALGFAVTWVADRRFKSTR